MVINDLDVQRATALPTKTDAPLIIDADTILTLSVTLQLFKLVARRGQQIAQIFSIMQVK